MSLRTASLRRSLRRALLAALVLLVPLHGLVAAVFASLGPLHTHRTTDATAMLEDVRRVMPDSAAAPRHLHALAGIDHLRATPGIGHLRATPGIGHLHELPRSGHAHAGDSLQRHHHAPGDPGVVRAADASDADDEGGGTSPSLGVFAALTAAPGKLPVLTAPRLRAESRHCAWLTDDPEPFERPPRRT